MQSNIVTGEKERFLDRTHDFQFGAEHAYQEAMQAVMLKGMFLTEPIRYSPLTFGLRPLGFRGAATAEAARFPFRRSGQCRHPKAQTFVFQFTVSEPQANLRQALCGIPLAAEAHWRADTVTLRHEG